MTPNNIIHLLSSLILLAILDGSISAQIRNNPVEIASSESGELVNDMIKGRVKINDQFYTVACTCGDESATNNINNGPTCDPSKLKILQDKTGEGATFDQIRNLVGHPSDLEYVDVQKTPFYCLDGRHSKTVLGGLGGDIGEFILGLMIYHEIVEPKRQIDQITVDRYFNSYLKYMKHDKFVMCTDDSAISHLERELAIEGLNLNNPRQQVQDEALESLEKPENNGDIHLRMLLKYSDMYAVDVNIVKAVIKSFYKVLWDKNNEFNSKLLLEILIGDHQESAFLEVRSNDACINAHLAPLLRVKEVQKGGVSIFMNHLDAVAIRRQDMAKFFTTYVGHHQPGLDAEILYNRMKHHGLAFLETTGSFMAKDLPFYSVNII